MTHLVGLYVGLTGSWCRINPTCRLGDNRKGVFSNDQCNWRLSRAQNAHLPARDGKSIAIRVSPRCDHHSQLFHSYALRQSPLARAHETTTVLVAYLFYAESFRSLLRTKPIQKRLLRKRTLSLVPFRVQNNPLASACRDPRVRGGVDLVLSMQSGASRHHRCGHVAPRRGLRSRGRVGTGLCLAQVARPQATRNAAPRRARVTGALPSDSRNHTASRHR